MTWDSVTPESERGVGGRRLTDKQTMIRNCAALVEIATEIRITGTTALKPEWLRYIYPQSPVASAVVRGPEHIFVDIAQGLSGRPTERLPARRSRRARRDRKVSGLWKP